jgi:hypothetical protein
MPLRLRRTLPWILACPLLSLSVLESVQALTTEGASDAIRRESGNGEELQLAQASTPRPFCPGGNFENVPVYYTDPSIVSKQIGSLGTPGSDCDGAIVGTNAGSPKSIMIFGSHEGRKLMKLYISTFDLPRERVDMDLWAIQISSTNKAKLTEVMDQVQRQIEQTREAMQRTYNKFSELSSNTIIDPKARALLTELKFQRVLNDDPRLSLTQMLLKLALANDPIRNYNNSALRICNFFANDANSKRFSLYNTFEGRSLETYDIQRIFNDDPPRPYRRPFQGFMTLGLHQRFDDKSRNPVCGDGKIMEPLPQTATPADAPPAGTVEAAQQEHTRSVEAGVARRRQAILDFAAAYKKYRQWPANSDTYDPEEIAQKAAIVDDMLSPVVDAIKRDVEAYFIQPTLLKIRQIVGRNRGVEYAEVGRTTINGINGNEVSVISGTTTSFDEPTPLRLSKWLEDANTDLRTAESLLPNLRGTELGKLPKGLLAPGVSNTLLGLLPAPQAVALLSALSKEEVSWQALSSGIDLKLTPIVMRNQAQATVDVSLTIADPATKSASDPTATGKPNTASSTTLRPLSRISKSELKTKVYVNTWDLFALSSFNNQTTVTGRRWYVPLVGTIWEGAFGDIPVLGGWFSFKRPPQNVQHQSIILTNTLIVPSAMGMGSYYSINGPSRCSSCQSETSGTGQPQPLEVLPRRQ